MKQTIAAKELAAALIEARVRIHEQCRIGRTSRNACRSLYRLRQPSSAVPGAEIAALLAVSNACRRAAGEK